MIENEEQNTMRATEIERKREGEREERGTETRIEFVRDNSP